MAPQGPGGALESVLVRVYSAPSVGVDGVLHGELRHELEYPLGVSAQRPLLPAELALVPRDSEARGVVGVEVQARAGGRELFTTRAIAGYVAGQHTVLELFLADRCRTESSRCDPRNTSCSREGCEPIERPRLPTRAEFDLGLDAGIAPDALSAHDARDALTELDSTPRDGAHTDGPPTTDARPPADGTEMTDASSCDGALLFCDGACVDPRTTRIHCGGCGIRCGLGDLCLDGVCRVEPRVHTLAGPGRDTLTAVGLSQGRHCAAGLHTGALYADANPVALFGSPPSGSTYGFVACFDDVGTVSHSFALRPSAGVLVTSLAFVDEGLPTAMLCAAGSFTGSLTIAPAASGGTLNAMGPSDGFVHCIRLDGSPVAGSPLRIGGPGTERAWGLVATRTAAFPNSTRLALLVGYDDAFSLAAGPTTRVDLPRPANVSNGGETALLGLDGALRASTLVPITRGTDRRDVLRVVEMARNGEPGTLVYGNYRGNLTLPGGTALPFSPTDRWWAAWIDARNVTQWPPTQGGNAGDLLAAVAPTVDGVGVIFAGTASVSTFYSHGYEGYGVEDVLMLRYASTVVPLAPSTALWGSRERDTVCAMSTTSRGLVLAATFVGSARLSGGPPPIATPAPDVSGVALVALDSTGTLGRTHSAVPQSADLSLRCVDTAASTQGSALLLGLNVRSTMGRPTATLAGLPITLRGDDDVALVWMTPPR